MRLGVAVLAVLAALALAACAAPPGVFRADRSDPLLTAPPLTEAVTGGVWIAPVPGIQAEPFRRALANALVRRDVPAGLDSVGPGGARLLATPAPATHAGRGYVRVDWRLERVDGTVLDAFAVATPLDFRIERPETKAAIAKVADRLAVVLGAPPPEAIARTIVVAVPPARTDGFADGGPLARAMATALATEGFQPGAAEAAGAIVRASARVRPATGQEGVVVVTIRWAVVTPDGREVGAADQENLLPAALAANGLQAIAADAATAAVQSVAGLVRLAAKTPAPSTGEGAS